MQMAKMETLYVLPQQKFLCQIIKQTFWDIIGISYTKMQVHDLKCTEHTHIQVVNKFITKYLPDICNVPPLTTSWYPSAHEITGLPTTIVNWFKVLISYGWIERYRLSFWVFPFIGQKTYPNHYVSISSGLLYIAE